MRLVYSRVFPGAWAALWLAASIGAAEPGEAAAHWAFQPVRNPPLPAVHNTYWFRSPVDRFILARLEAAGLAPSPPAGVRTLLRRIYFDLTGLPPTFGEIRAFEKQALRNPRIALERVVDRLLASPHHGERWGRHWLDVARHADTKDQVLQFGINRIRPYAYTYRDYVIRALNADTSYDQFVAEQLAAEQIHPPVEKWRLAGMGLLTVGRFFDGNPHDILDDQIDTVTRGFLGLTVSCARCHDHKYDPIPTEDYYSLHGVFANSERPLELPLIEEPIRTPDYLQFAEKEKEARKKLYEHVDAEYQKITEEFQQSIGDYLMEIVSKPRDELEDAIFFRSFSPGDLRPQILARWRRFLENRVRSDDPVFGLWHALMNLPRNSFSTRAGVVVEEWLRAKKGNPLVSEALAGTELETRADVARVYGNLLKQVYQESKDGEPDANQRQLLVFVTGRQSPHYFTRRQTPLYMTRVPKDAYNGLVRDLDRLAVQMKGAPPRAMSLVDSTELHEPFVFVRGNPQQRGRPVARQFLGVLSGRSRHPFQNGSGRLDLARAITNHQNPLTARVMVNRVWMHHFGEPLVSTPSDFGMRSDPPSHPDLLDHLAWKLMHEDGWSLKKLHRQILLSATWQQASADRPECRAIDPGNRLLWRANQRRLDFEAMRDSMLSVAGRLDRTIHGQPVNVAGDPKNRRRTVYGLIDRQELPGLYRVFDFANPDQTTARRPKTTTPQQALFTMNSPFMATQARELAERSAKPGRTDSRSRVRELHRLALGRDPSGEELESAAAFIATARNELQLDKWAQLAQVLLLTNEAIFID